MFYLDLDIGFEDAWQMKRMRMKMITVKMMTMVRMMLIMMIAKKTMMMMMMMITSSSTQAFTPASTNIRQSHPPPGFGQNAKLEV